MIVHAGLAAVSKVPEIAIDGEEGQMLAQASANVLAQFDIAPDPKVQAIIGLVMACGVVYAPRVIMFKARMEQQRKETETGEAGIYDANGTPLGTAPFSVVGNKPSQVGK